VRAHSSRVWSPTGAAGICTLFLTAFFFGGLRLGLSGVEYEIFGLVDGLAALLIVYVLLNTAALSWPRDLWGLIVLAYAAASTAQLVSMLLPPPGLVEWLVLAVLLYFAWNASYAAHRTRVMLTLGTVALALAALKYSVLPFIWARTSLPETPLIDVRALAEGIKGLLASYVPSQPITQVFAFAAILAWVLAVWLQWPPETEDDWLWRLPRSDRDRLLLWLLTEGQGRGRELSGEEARGRIEGVKGEERRVKSEK
jgi:hypothetical protein